MASPIHLSAASVSCTPNDGGSADDSWHYAVGCPTGTDEDDCESPYPNGFDGELYPITTLLGDVYQNIAGYLFVFNDTLYCGTLQYFDSTADPKVPNNANIWKSKDGLTWEKITVSGFDDDQIIMFESFASFKNKLYVSGSKSANTELYRARWRESLLPGQRKAGNSSRHTSNKKSRSIMLRDFYYFNRHTPGPNLNGNLLI